MALKPDQTAALLMLLGAFVFVVLRCVLPLAAFGALIGLFFDNPAGFAVWGAWGGAAIGVFGFGGLMLAGLHDGVGRARRHVRRRPF